MRTVIAHALEERVDMVALVPEYRTGSFTMDAIWASFMRALALAVDPRAVADPGKRTVIGSGAFNLVARSAYDRTPGMAHLRLETGDDVALAAMVKEHGGRVEMLNGRGHASVAVYRNVREFLRGVEKNGSSLAQRPLPLLISAFALLLVIEYAPIAVVVLGLLGKAPSWLLLIGALATAASTAVSMTSLWVNTRTWLAGLAWPFGLAMMVVGILRSVVLAHRRGGIIWRGTFYPLEEISAGQRFTL